MRCRLILCVMAVMFAAPSYAQDDFILSQRDRDSIGIVEVRIGAAGLDTATLDPVERGSGVIISGAGHVLTAGHLLSSENYAICARAAQADGGKTCSISFLWHGDKARSFDLQIASEPIQGRDYIVLKLSASSDKIGRSSWPFVTLAKEGVDGEAIYATGYPGADSVLAGAANRIDTNRGTLRADTAQNCADSFGIARTATAVTAPGLSGGPTFNRMHRVVGIVLGAACPENSGSTRDDVPRSRILLIGDMTRLCQVPGLACFYGHEGDIDPVESAASKAWYKRLIGGQAVADRHIYGWRMREVAKLTNYAPICGQLMMDSQLVRSVQADAEAGSQLAAVYAALWDACRPGAMPVDTQASRERLEILADAGYEPAQYFIAAVVVGELQPKFAARQSIHDPLLFSASDSEKLKKAESYYRASAAHGWPASALALFNLCIAHVFACTPQEPGEFLDQARAEGQWEAIRIEATARLIGNAGDAFERFGFARPSDPAGAISLFQQAATPTPGASSNQTVMLFDNLSAGYLAYFYWGGRYRGKPLVAPNIGLAQQYGQSCLGGAMLGSPLYEFCTMINAVGIFNMMPGNAMHNSAWSTIQLFPPQAPIGGPLAQNLATWSATGAGISRISCDLSDYLTLVAPTTPPQFSEGSKDIAYCYFPRPAMP